MNSNDAKTIVITGATGGIGEEAAFRLAHMHARVYLVGRTLASAESAIARIRRRTDRGRLHPVHANLADAAAIERAAAEILASTKRIDVLVNNAGVAMPRRQENSAGVEQTFAVNHLAYHRMTTALLDRLKATAASYGEARIVSTASAAHLRAQPRPGDIEMQQGYNGWTQYCNTKLMNIQWTARLSRELQRARVSATCYHPGFVRTSLGRGLRLVGSAIMLMGISPKRGADTMVWLATSPEVRGATGGYYYKRRPARTSHAATDLSAQEQLWHTTLEYDAAPA